MVDFLTLEEQAELAMIYIYGFEGKLNVQSPEATTVYQAAKQKLQKLLSTEQAATIPIAETDRLGEDKESSEEATAAAI